MEQPNPLTARSTWTRLLYMAFFASVLQLVELTLVLVVLAQIALKLFRGETFPELRSVGSKLADYARHIIAFLTFSTEELPFPFAPRPQRHRSEAANATAAS